MLKYRQKKEELIKLGKYALKEKTAKY